MQAINQGNGWRVMVGSLLAPVIHYPGEIEVPALHFRLPVAKQLFHARAHRNGRHAWRPADGLLGSAEADIDPLSVYVERHAAEGGDGAHDQERPELLGYLAKWIDLRDDAGRGFPVCQAHKLDLATLSRTAHIIGVHGPAKRRGNAVDRGASALGNFRHAGGKHTIHADNGFVTRLERIHHRRFNAAGSRCGNREGNVVLRLKNTAQQGLNAAHELSEPRIDVPHHGRGQGAVNARAHARRAWGEHQPSRRPQFLHRIDHDFKPQLSRGALLAHPKMCSMSCAQTLEDGSVDKSTVPVAFRNIALQSNADHLLVCAIPCLRATAKMAVSEPSSTTTLPQRAERISPRFSLCSLC